MNSVTTGKHNSLDTVDALVNEVVYHGRHGPYAVARHKEYGSITFALNTEVWPESSYPVLGEIVRLSQFRKMSGGWRAMEARRLQLSK